MSGFGVNRSAAYAVVPSRAYARTHGGIEFPPDPPGSVMYLVCNRRRQIWRLKPNTGGGGPAFQIEAQRGPLWPDVTTPTYRSTMGPIEGDSTGCWYMEAPASGHPNGPVQSLQVPLFEWSVLVFTWLHRLDAQLNHVASYGFKVVDLQGTSSQGLQWPQNVSGSIGGGSGVFTIGAAPSQIGYHATFSDFTSPGGIVSFNLAQLLSKCHVTASSGTAIGGVFVVGNRLGTLLPSVSIDAVSRANEVIPLPNYQNMFGDATQFPTAPTVGVVGGTGTTIYGTHLGNPEYMAKWVNGSLAAYKTPVDQTPQDQFRAQCIGGSTSVCYTTENNNEIVIRDGGLNLVRRLQRAEIETFLGPNNPANGVSNFTFTGIGGR